MLEVSTGHQERKAQEGEQGLPGHPSSNIHGSSICSLASGTSANEGATQLLENELPSSHSLPSPSPFPAAGGEAGLTPLVFHQGVPRPPLFVFNTEGSFGGAVVNCNTVFH